MEAKPCDANASDVTDDEWAFAAPNPNQMRPDAPRRVHDPREAFNAAHWLVRAGDQWWMPPHDLPPWEAVHQQARRWLVAGCFVDMVQDLRAILRWFDGRADGPTAAVLDSRTVQSTPESGARGPYGSHTKRTGSKVPLAVGTLGHLMALRVTLADAQDWDRGAAYTGLAPEGAPAAHRIALEVVWPPRPSAASSPSLGAGSWSAPRPGRAASAALRGTTSGHRKRSPACTSSPSPA